MPKKTVIHVGQRFGMLVVIDADVVVPESELTAHERARGCVKRRISVQCDCGNKSVMVAGNVLKRVMRLLSQSFGGGASFKPCA